MRPGPSVSLILAERDIGSNIWPNTDSAVFQFGTAQHPSSAAPIAGGRRYRAPAPTHDYGKLSAAAALVDCVFPKWFEWIWWIRQTPTPESLLDISQKNNFDQ